MIPFIDLEGGFLTTEELLFLAGASGGGGVEHTIINNPATFTTDMAKPLRKLLIPFTPVQAGSGDPSPSNIRPITGWTGVNINRTGKNILNAVAADIVPFESAGYDNYTLSDGTVHITGQTLFGFKVPVKPGINYRWSFVIDSGVTVEAFDYSAEPDKIRNSDHVCYYQANRSEGTIPVPAGSTWIAFAVFTTKTDVTISDIQIEVGSTTSEYAPYVGTTIPVSWQTEKGTVYGGTLDALTGVLTVEWVSTSVLWGNVTRNPPGESMTAGYIALDYETKIAGESGVSNEHKCNSATWIWSGEANTTPHFYVYRGSSGKCTVLVYLPNGTDEDLNIVIVSKLKEPYTVQVDPVTLSTLIGENVLWTDTNGDNTIVYLKKT